MSPLSDDRPSLEDSCRRLLCGRSHQQLLFCQRYLATRSTPHLSQRPHTPPPQRLAIPILLLLISISIPLLYLAWPYLRLTLGTNPCLIPNNFVLMEATRPISHCDICAADLPVRLHRPSRAEFAAHAYRGRPVLVSGATEAWPARRSVDLPFLRRLYAQLNANASVTEDGCQFLSFRSPLESLRQVMEGRVDGVPDGPPWYIGWSNCDPRVAAMLRGLYRWPDFLPEDGEGSAIDWIFMGTPGQGTAVHRDFTADGRSHAEDGRSRALPHLVGDRGMTCDPVAGVTCDPRDL